MVCDGKRIFLLEIKDIGVKFLRSNNYWPGNEDDLRKQFEIDVEKTFFPVFFNQDINYSYSGIIPDEKYFFEFSDTQELRHQKIEFIKKMQVKTGVLQKRYLFIAKIKC